MTLVRALVRNLRNLSGDAKGKRYKQRKLRGRKYRCGGVGADCSVIARKAGVMPVERRGQVTDVESEPNWQQEELRFSTGGGQPSFGGTSRMTRECQVRICERLGVENSPGRLGSVAENVGTRSRQARLREASASEPSMKCRKRIRRCRNRGVPLPPGSAREKP